MSRRILFVDDERNILEGLRHRLHHQRRRWEMRFVESGREALEVLAGERFDVIVSDMRMPEMDGTALLRAVWQEYPEMARIVLSGHADERAMLHAMTIAHQFLPKPCDAAVLVNVVERVCDLRERMKDESVRQAVGRMTNLPAQPGLYSRLVSVLTDERASPSDVADVLAQDAALCTQILHIVNSAYYGLDRSIVAVEEAVVYLGLETVRQLALVAEIFRYAGAIPALGSISRVAVHRHVVLTASIASSFFESGRQRDTAFVTGLLHDVGKLLMAVELPDRLREIATVARNEGGPMDAIERRLHGVTHAEIGAYLLGLWHIPFEIVEAVAFHHDPSSVQSQGFHLSAAIHVADVLANEQLEPVITGARNSVADLDAAYMERLGITTASLAQWRELAKEQTRAQSTRL